jgi:hypothetical protein
VTYQPTLPSDVAKAWLDAQTKADANGVPVRFHMTLTAGAQVIGHHVAWVYPLATFDQWMIERDADGTERPVFIGASEVGL